MNSEDAFYKNKFFLVEHNAKLLYDDSTINNTTLNFPIGKNGMFINGVKEVRKVRLIYDNRTCIMYLDERFNDLEFRGFDNISGELFFKSKDEKVIDYLTDKYQELKNSDFRYKRGDGYEGDKSIYLEDFIEHLKIENRDKTIEKILENE
jgi:hypothetical protein